MQCITCLTEVAYSPNEVTNFCKVCGTSLTKVCSCWVMDKPYQCHQDKCPGMLLAIEGFKTGKSKEEQRDYKYALLLEIARKLEWSTVISLPNVARVILCCPICGGIRPQDYKEEVFEASLGRIRGHKKECLFGIMQNTAELSAD